jgi:hypothetical protein
LPPIDDPLPGQPDNVFRIVRQMLLTPSSAKADSTDQGRDAARRDCGRSTE